MSVPNNAEQSSVWSFPHYISSVMRCSSLKNLFTWVMRMIHVYMTNLAIQFMHDIMSDLLQLSTKGTQGRKRAREGEDDEGYVLIQ